jgi:hypothetical protein
VVLGAALVACTPPPDHAGLRTALAALAAAPEPPPGDSWAMAPAELEGILADEVLEVRSHESAGGGVTGAVRERVFAAVRGRDLMVKWKRAPAGDADGWNNSPRKEIAAYAVQKWFLDPDDYVVPTTVMRCPPLERYRTYEPRAAPTIPGTHCVLGVASLWLTHVRVPDRLYDETRFLTDPRYAYHMANFNLLTYLVDHRDGRRGNFLVSADPTNRRVFAVDNGISFGAWIYNYFVPNWNSIRVPALRRAAIDRLRGVSREDLDALGVLVEMRADAQGILRQVPPGPNLDPTAGTRIRPGFIQLGLTRREIAALAMRIRTLLAAVDAGEVSVY